MVEQHKRRKTEENGKNAEIARLCAVGDEHRAHNDWDNDVYELIIASARIVHRKAGERDEDDAVGTAVIVDNPTAHAEPLTVGDVLRPGEDGEHEREQHERRGDLHRADGLLFHAFIAHGIYKAHRQHGHLRHARHVCDVAHGVDIPDAQTVERVQHAERAYHQHTYQKVLLFIKPDEHDDRQRDHYHKADISRPAGMRVVRPICQHVQHRLGGNQNEQPIVAYPAHKGVLLLHSSVPQNLIPELRDLLP